jgi:branched-chain amino acid transport system permease protein
MIPLQLFWNAIVPAALFGVIAASFTVIHRVCKVLHLAHGGVVMVGAYIYLWGVRSGFGVFEAALLAMLSAGLMGLACALIVYEPLRRRHHLSVIGNLIAALALLLIFEAGMLVVFGSRTQHTTPFIPLRVVHIGGVILTTYHLALLVVSGLCFAVLALVLAKTKLGRAMRAVADHEEVARIVGIDPVRVRCATYVLSSMIAGIAGVMLAGELAFEPRFATTVAIEAFLRSVIGGVGSVGGALAGSLLVDVVKNLWAWFGSSAFREAAGLLLAIGVLLWRPWGLFGRRSHHV